MHRRILIFLMPLFLLSFVARSQDDDGKGQAQYWSVGLNAGTIGFSPAPLHHETSTYLHRTGNFGIGVLTNNQGTKRPSITANTSIGVHAGFTWKDKRTKNLTGIWLEFQRNKACYSYKEPFSYSFKGDTSAGWVDADTYLKYSISLMRTWHFDQEHANANGSWFAKAGFGQTFYHRNLGENMPTGYQEDWTENGTGKKLTVLTANAASQMASLELGRQVILDGGNLLHFGIVYYMPLLDTRTVQYEYFRQNISQGKSTINYKGSTVMLNLTYTCNYKIRHKPVDSTKMKQYNDLARADTSERSVQHRHKVNGRHFEVQESVTVSNGTITLLVWDKNRVDGDEISLYLNGKPVLENYTVSKTKKEVIINLEPGTNTLVMYALNLGRIPPNTAALNINDGGKKKNVTLVSDLHKSGAIEIIYNP